MIYHLFVLFALFECVYGKEVSPKERCGTDVCHVENAHYNPCSKCACAYAVNCECVQNIFFDTKNNKRSFRYVSLLYTVWKEICIHYQINSEYSDYFDDKIYKEIVDDRNFLLFKNFSKYDTIFTLNSTSGNSVGYMCIPGGKLKTAFHFIVHISTNKTTSYSGCIGISGEYDKTFDQTIMIMLIILGSFLFCGAIAGICYCLAENSKNSDSRGKIYY